MTWTRNCNEESAGRRKLLFFLLMLLCDVMQVDVISTLCWYAVGCSSVCFVNQRR